MCPHCLTKESSIVRRILAILLPGLAAADRLRRRAGPRSGAHQPVRRETAKLDSVKLTEKGEKEAPGVEFAKPLDVAEPTVKVITEGSGERVKANQVAEISILALNGTDGTTLEDTLPVTRSRLN